MDDQRHRIAVIGHTGRGDFGHDLDIAFLGLPKCEIVAVADPDPGGRAAAQQRSGAPTAYGDYHAMLSQEAPDVVVIAPRFLDERLEMVQAAAEAGAHIFLEKPLAATLADADGMLEACDQRGLKVAVAHHGRLHPTVLYALEMVQAGEVGRMRLIRGYGKMDHRGGAQDLMVLGTHVLDAMRLFAGNAVWASADMMSGSLLAGRHDVSHGTEGVIAVAGDGLRATYGFEGGVIGMFESFAGMGAGEQLFGLDIAGESGQLSLRGDVEKRLLRYPYPYVVPGYPDDRWEAVPVPEHKTGIRGEEDWSPPASGYHRVNRRLAHDLLTAIEEDREPRSSGARARAALEMIQAVATAHVRGGRIDLPLEQRTHPFAELV